MLLKNKIQGGKKKPATAHIPSLRKRKFRNNGKIPSYTIHWWTKAAMLNSRQGHSRPALCARRPLELCSERAAGHAQQPAEGSLTEMCSQWKGASLTSTSSWLYQKIFRETNRDRIMHVITIIFYPTINKSEHYPAEGVLHLRKGRADPYLQRQARQLSSSGRSPPALLGRLSSPARLSPPPQRSQCQVSSAALQRSVCL